MVSVVYNRLFKVIILQEQRFYEKLMFYRTSSRLTAMGIFFVDFKNQLVSVKKIYELYLYIYISPAKHFSLLVTAFQYFAKR